jgi:hypothetical protein
MSNRRYTPETYPAGGILFAFLLSLTSDQTGLTTSAICPGNFPEYPGHKKTTVMKNADKPFIGILIITIAILYSVIAMIS